MAARHGTAPSVRVDRRLASFWFHWTVKPEGWSLPPQWDPLAGDYPARDGWIRLHTNAPHHRAAVLTVLGAAADKDAVAEAAAKWRAEDLESAVIDAGGCAAVMHTAEEWAAHPQGRAAGSEPLVRLIPTATAPPPQWRIRRDRPLDGIRVLDCTRILAGPVATRFLAGLGADVLRIDPTDWHEHSAEPEVTLGKRCARLDLRTPEGRATFESLLHAADVFVHGYRSDAFERLGLGAARRHELRPGLVDVALDAYGWSGPWRARRGYDSLVQMSSGIAHAGMVGLNKEKPTPLPVQALDHATGYLMAAAALHGLTQRLATSAGCEARASLARTAALLLAHPGDPAMPPPAALGEADYADQIEATSWGPARRLKPPVHIEGAPLFWMRPATELGTSRPAW